MTRAKATTRDTANAGILDLLLRASKEFPNLRFVQLLHVVGVLIQEDGQPVDQFYEESGDTYRRVHQLYFGLKRAS